DTWALPALPPAADFICRRREWNTQASGRRSERPKWRPRRTLRADPIPSPIPRLPMLTRRALLDEATERLADAGVEDARRSAEWMLEEAAGVSRVALLAQGHEPVTDEERDAFEEMLARRLRREPL